MSSSAHRPPPPWQASEPPPWALEMCLACTRHTSLEAYKLSCCCSCRQCCHDHRRCLFAVAWICDHCNYVLESVGLYTNWPAAQDARRRTLKQRELDGTSLWRGTRSSS
jgi:hypothetical protein